MVVIGLVAELEGSADPVWPFGSELGCARQQLGMSMMRSTRASRRLCRWPRDRGGCLRLRDSDGQATEVHGRERWRKGGDAGKIWGGTKLIAVGECARNLRLTLTLNPHPQAAADTRAYLPLIIKNEWRRQPFSCGGVSSCPEWPPPEGDAEG